MTKIEAYPADKIVKVTLSKAKLDSLGVSWVYFEGVDYLQHQKESRRWTVGLLVLLLCQLPVRHDVPDYLVLIYRTFFQFLVLKVYDLEKPEHVWTNSSAVNTELLNDLFFDICEGVVGLDPDENTVAYREIDWNRDLSFAHQSHHLVLYWHVAYSRRVLYASQHFLEQISQVLFFLLAVLLVLQPAVEDVQSCKDEVRIRNVYMEKHSQRLVDSYRGKLMLSVALLNQLQKDLVF